jgi:F-type H+-transporting ATPase subunit b
MGFLNWGSFVIQFVNLLVVLYVLNRFLWKPFLSYLDEENAKRSELESAHAEVTSVREKAEEEAKDLVAAAKAEAKSIRDEAKVLAKQEGSLIVFEANKEADAVRAKAVSDIENERRALETAMKSKVAEVALKINEKMFGKSDANAKFVENAVKEL